MNLSYLTHYMRKPFMFESTHGEKLGIELEVKALGLGCPGSAQNLKYQDLTRCLTKGIWRSLFRVGNSRKHFRFFEGFLIVRMGVAGLQKDWWNSKLQSRRSRLVLLLNFKLVFCCLNYWMSKQMSNEKTVTPVHLS